MTNEYPHTRELFAPLETVLMITPEPVPTAQLAEATNAEEVFVLEALEDLAVSCRGENGGQEYGFELRRNAGGWRIYSVCPWADFVGRFIMGSATSRLSQVTLETLAVAAYRQPVSRLHISHIHGVNADAVVRILVARRLIEEVGESVSGARLYGTTCESLEKVGSAPLDELMPLAPYLPTGEELGELEEPL